VILATGGRPKGRVDSGKRLKNAGTTGEDGKEVMVTLKEDNKYPGDYCTPIQAAPFVGRRGEKKESFMRVREELCIL